MESCALSAAFSSCKWSCFPKEWKLYFSLLVSVVVSMPIFFSHDTLYFINGGRSSFCLYYVTHRCLCLLNVIIFFLSIKLFYYHDKTRDRSYRAWKRTFKRVDYCLDRYVTRLFFLLPDSGTLFSSRIRPPSLKRWLLFTHVAPHIAEIRLHSLTVSCSSTHSHF